jgi:glyoxylate reductase
VPWQDAPDSQYAAVVEGVFVYGKSKVTGPLLDRLPRVRVVSNHGVGVDHIDLAAAAERGIPVGNTPDVLNGAVADAAFALLLATARRIVEGDRFVRQPDCVAFPADAMTGTEVHGTTLGIVGLGRIGSEIARRAHGFRMKILYHNRRRREDTERQLSTDGISVEYVSFRDLLNAADHIISILPHTPDTVGKFDAAAFAAMKETAIFVNIGRGTSVDTCALADSLAHGRPAAAGLDVTSPEPLRQDHPLRQLPNVVLTPHLGSATRQTRRRMGELAVANLLRGLQNLPLLASPPAE